MTSIKDYGMKWKTTQKSKDLIEHKIVMEDDPTIVASIKAKRIGCCNFKVETTFDDEKAPFGNDNKVSEKDLKLFIKDIKKFINNEIIVQEEY